MAATSKSLLAHAEKLHALRVLLEAKSFRRAAATLGVSSPALSQSIATLEQHVGHTLAVRGRGGVLPTPWAEQLLAAVGPALEAIRSFDEAPAAATLPATKLRVGAYESIAVYAVPELLARLGARHPKLRVTIRTGRSPVLLSLLRRGELDVALVAGSEGGDKLAVDVLGRDHLSLWASPIHPVFREGVTRETPYAGLAPGPDGLPLFYRRFVRAMGLGDRPFIECDSFEALRMMALRHVAIAILPRRVVERAPGELRAVAPPRGAATEVGAHDIRLMGRRGDNEPARRVLAAELRTLLATA